MRDDARPVPPAFSSRAFRSPAKERVFAFDLDGTVTSCEMLPLIARRAGLEKEIAELTRRTLLGEIAFAESFRKRFAMLRRVPLRVVHDTVASVPLDPHIEAFITRRQRECVIVTGNLDIWIQPLLTRLGCRWFASRGAIVGNRPVLLSVLDKGAAARKLRSEGRDIVAVGESVNDIPLFRAASVGIAFAGVHAPVAEIRELARLHANDGSSLCRLLEAL